MDRVLYSESDSRLRAQVAEFTRREIAPVAVAFDARAEVPEAVYRAFFDLGLLHGYIPEAYGGRSHTAVTTTVVAEELAFGCLAMAAALMVAILPISIVLRGGCECQRETWLRPLTRTFSLPAIACTEADAGSDLRSTATRAVRVGKEFHISGQKTYVSNLPYAGFVVVIARTESGERTGSGRSLSAFVVPRDAPGMEIGPRWNTAGLRSMAVCSLTLKDVVVPETSLLGEEGDGLSLLNAGLDISRIMMASYAVGAARRVIGELLELGRSRGPGGERLSHKQDFRFRLVDMEEQVATARLLAWLAATSHDAGLKSTREASLAKLHSGRMCSRIGSEALALTEGLPFAGRATIEKFYREAPAIRIIEGSEPIQREIIFAEMLRRGLY